MKNFTLLCLSAFSALTMNAQVVTWQQSYVNATGSYSLASTKNGNVYAAQNGTLLMSTHNGATGTWTTMTSPATAGDIYANENILFMVDHGGKGLLRSTDYGVTWKAVNSGMIGSDSEHLGKLIHVSGNNYVLLHHGSSVNKIYVSDDGGLSWSANLNMFSQSGVTVVQKGSNYYLITTGTVYESTDGGLNWNNLTVTFPSSSFSGQVQVLSDGTMVMGGGIIRTSTDGITWTAVTTNGFPVGAYVRQLIKSPASDTLYASTELTATSIYSLYYSADKGVTWAPFNNGLSTNAQIAFNNYTTLMIGYDGYMYASPENGDIQRTGAPVSSSRVVPDNTTGIATAQKDAALQLYPNPATQNVDVTVSTQGAATINITNLLGNVVATKTQNLTGQTNVRMDVSALATGNYFISVQTAEGIRIGRFVKQ